MRLRTAATFLPLTIAVVAATLVVAPGIAHAKVVPSSATVEGDRLAGPIHLDGSGDQFPRLVEQAGFFVATMSLEPDPMLDQAPTTDLGPVLEITWQVADHDAENAIAGTVRQLVYPHAAGGPLTYTEPGQAVVDGVTAPGGWYRAPVGIAGSLTALGVPVDDLGRAAAGAAGTTGATGPTGATAAPPDAGAPLGWLWAAAPMVLLGLLGGTAVWAARRRDRMRLTAT
jgi:hypothetical protein